MEAAHTCWGTRDEKQSRVLGDFMVEDWGHRPCSSSSEALSMSTCHQLSKQTFSLLSLQLCSLESLGWTHFSWASVTLKDFLPAFLGDWHFLQLLMQGPRGTSRAVAQYLSDLIPHPALGASHICPWALCFSPDSQPACKLPNLHVNFSSSFLSSVFSKQFLKNTPLPSFPSS